MINHLLALPLHGIHVRRSMERRHVIFEINCLRMEPVRRLPSMREAKLPSSALQHFDNILLLSLWMVDRPCTWAILIESGKRVVPPVRFADFISHEFWRGPLTISCWISFNQFIWRFSVHHPVNNVAP